MDKKEELKKYLALIGKPVEKEFATFSVKEDKILNQYGAWMTALIKGEINPMTKKQNEFIRTIFVNGDYGTIYEIAYKKYLNAYNLAGFPSLISPNRITSFYQLAGYESMIKEIMENHDPKNDLNIVDREGNTLFFRPGEDRDLTNPAFAKLRLIKLKGIS